MNFSRQFTTGLSFGLTSGVITTLGLIMGLFAGTNSQLAVIGGIVTIAVADALSDAFGIHASEEAEGVHTAREVWAATVFTFLAKLIIALTFTIPILLFPLALGAMLSVVWGLFILILFSFYVAKKEETAAWKVILEHTAIALLVVIASYYLGEWVAATFSS
jgi:VIT1/CCC1 family predicted Fe2+/Mn2+ transporter